MRSLAPRLSMLLGLPILVALVGCGAEQSSSLPPAPIEWEEMGHEHAVHMHPTEGPHQGMLLEIGKGDYHAELVHDDARNLVGIYLLDERAMKPVLVTEAQLPLNLMVDGKPTQFHLLATPLEGEPLGHSSHFELVDANLSAALHQLDNRSRFNVTIQGRPFVVPIPKNVSSKDHVAGRPQRDRQ